MGASGGATGAAVGSGGAFAFGRALTLAERSLVSSPLSVGYRIIPGRIHTGSRSDSSFTRQPRWPSFWTTPG